MRLLNSRTDVICSGFTEILVRSDNELAILALKESAVTALKLAGVNVKADESALYDSESNGFAESAVKDAKDAVRTNLACLVRRFGQEFPGGHPVLTWLVKYSVAMVNRCERSRRQDSLRVAQGSADSQGHCRILRRRSSS